MADLKNGRPVLYGTGGRLQHRTHIHVPPLTTTKENDRG